MANRQCTVTLRLTEEEYALAEMRASDYGMKINVYLRVAAIYYPIVEENYDVVREHTKMLGEVKDSINRVAFTIHASNNYLPREIEAIFQLMKDTYATERALLDTLRKTTPKGWRVYRKDKKKLI